MIGFVYTFIKKDYFNNKLILKAITETEYENNITSLNAAHEEYSNYIEQIKKKIDCYCIASCVGSTGAGVIVHLDGIEIHAGEYLEKFSRPFVSSVPVKKGKQYLREI